MSVLGFLDQLGNTAVGLSTATAQVRDNLRGAKTSDQTPPAFTSPVQTGNTGIPTLWIVGGVLVIGLGAFLLLRRS